MYAILKRTTRGYTVEEGGLTEEQADAKITDEAVQVLVEYRRMGVGALDGITAWEIEATQWYHSDGFCKLQISDMTAPAALRLFGAVLWAEEKVS